MPANQHRESDSRKSSANDPRTQVEKFADLARELECDEDEAAFDERLKKLAKAPPEPKPPKPLA
jgi:hypothetical protein